MLVIAGFCGESHSVCLCIVMLAQLFVLSSNNQLFLHSAALENHALSSKLSELSAEKEQLASNQRQLETELTALRDQAKIDAEK